MGLLDVLGLLTLLGVAAALLLVLAVAALIQGLRRPPRKTYAVALGRGDPTEPEAAGLTGAAATLRLADGRATQAWFVRGERAGEAGAPIVIILHGFGDSRYGALTWAELLIPFASEVVVFDQRGQGEAEADATVSGTREATDVAAVIEQVRERESARVAGGDATESAGRAPIVLFGYSRGAMVALGAAAGAARPEVAGVIADGPYRYWHEPVREVLRRRRYPVEPVLTLARGALWLGRADMRGDDRVQQARRLECPLLVLHGSDDAFCPLASARAIAEAAPAGELVVFEGAGHLDLAALDPQRYREALRRFFTRVEEEESPGTRESREA